MHPNFDLICEENRQLFQLIVWKSRNCQGRKRSEHLFCHLALCRLLRERHEELKDKMFGPDKEKWADGALGIVKFVDKNLITEIRRRGFSDKEINKVVQRELDKVRLIFKI